AFGAHPDDVELSMGGTIISLVERGLTVGVVDLSQGELGTRGSKEKRMKEASSSAKVLGIDKRICLKLKDGDINSSELSIKKVVDTIRTYQPKIIFAPYFKDRHPDHESAALLVKKASFFSGLKNYQTGKKNLHPYRPKKLFYYMQSYTFEPTFIYDISNYFEEKMEAINSYSSQFYNPQSDEPETFISRPEFMSYLKARAEFYGFQIGKSYGEPFFCEERIEFDFDNFLTDKFQ
ncbi:MAG: bacillithiol biosynthesis deacetylase BshB1, partial [Ignavibacteria bacterium]|nr:bacillithiol biosynthesis deacetylase BshB1 [Ignavibacteria bacterium]